MPVLHDKPVKILIVDSQSITRCGLRALLAAEARFEIVGEANDGWSALKAVKQRKPDVVLLDTSLPKLNGIGTARMIAKCQRDTGILFLSADDGSASVLAAIETGAKGYLLKDCEQSELVTAVECIASGGAYLSPPVTSILINAYVQCTKGRDAVAKRDSLTHRERQVLQLVCEGLTNKEAASLLSICVKTVEKHRSSIKRKLNAGGTRELIEYWNGERKGAGLQSPRRIESSSSDFIRLASVKCKTEAANYKRQAEYK